MTAALPLHLAAPPGPATPPLIELDRVSRRFTLPDGRPLDAVREASLQVGAGEVIGLIGTSGAGKSTLLRLINLLERPDAGRVLFDGQDLTALPKPALRAARAQLGMIFQQFNLLQNATVFDNVAFPLRLHGRPDKAAVAARVHECLALVGLADKTYSHPAQLSGGQKQRVAIARALAPGPKVLLCDEPTSALDADTTHALLDTLADINARLGVTLVVVTHELGVVRRLCRRVAVIEQGRIAEDFALAQVGVQRVTSLGRALARLAARPADDADLDTLQAAWA
jgi:D-methionine transport system ATP-binding protein